MGTTDADVLDRLRARDQLLLSLSDVLDTKASIGMVAITFLATQSGELLTREGLPEVFRWFQFASVFCLALAGMAAVGSLWPRDHQGDTAEELDDWARQLREHYKDAPDPEQAVDQAFRRGTIDRMKERIAANKAIDDSKAALITKTYVLTGLALVLNLLTVVALAL